MSPSITSTLAFYSCITLSPNTRSIRNENRREEEEEKLHYTSLNYKIEMKLLLKLCISQTLEPQGGFYSHQGRGGPGDKPWPKTQSQKRSPGHVFAAILGPRARRFELRGPVCPLSGPVPGFWFTASDFDRISSLGQWLSLIGL